MPSWRIRISSALSSPEWAAAVEKGLDIRLAERDAGGAAIHHAANGRAMAFAPGGDAEEVAEAVMRHQRLLPQRGSAGNPQGLNI